MDSLSEDLKARLAEKTLKAARNIQNGGIAWKTGIFPCEMAVFLAACEEAGINGILESGRGPDAYSTHILSLYAETTGATITSLDFFPLEEKWYQSTLAQSKHITYETGNAFHLVPRIMRRMPSPCAVLIDGPKGLDAINLAAMTSRKFAPELIALHNTPSWVDWHSEFCRLYPEAFHLEDISPLTEMPEWQQFREWEHEQVMKTAPHAEHSLRDLTETSLILAFPKERPTLSQLLACKGQFKRHPAFLMFEWLVV